jgi:sialic acid synthase SpsE/sugar phosphate isomerase/epimerase
MYIDRNISNYIIHEDESVQDSLGELNKRKGRILIVTDNKDVVKGVVTNGDILRWLIDHPNPNLKIKISELINSNFKFVLCGNEKEIPELLKSINHVPIITKKNQLIAIGIKNTPKQGIKIDNKFISGSDSKTFVIAEIGNNHQGNISAAKTLVDHCVEAGADCAKFQMRDLESLYHNAGNTNDESENLGTQYTLDLLSKYQLSNEELIEVFDYCKEKEIIPLCTPWDIKSFEVLENYGMPAYKIASADLTNHELISEIAKTGKPIICSTGMSSEKEIVETIELINSFGCPFVMLHCNSTYPAPFEDINLNFIPRLKELSNAPVGYSGHERGIAVSIASVALGATVIERHITTDKSLEGNDHKVSLLPHEFKNLISGIREVDLALGVKNRILSQGEMMNRVNLAKSLVINQDLKKGVKIEKEMISVKSPGKGLQPNKMNELIGQHAKHDFKSGDFFYPNDIEQKTIQRRNYSFNRPWGIPVRFHDFIKLTKDIQPELVEFHLSYKDLNVDFEKHIPPNNKMDFVVHSPELFAEDHTLDLCAMDENYKSRSIKELQGVINLTRDLNKLFPKTKNPKIVVNVGGFSENDFLSPEEKSQCYEQLDDSLKKLDFDGVELIPQTMPPFPWHFGGQRYHNLFVSADEIVEFCQKHNMRICLDVSHSKLACVHNKKSFFEFLKKTAKYSGHLHIADSENTGGEGLQIGEGEIDFLSMGEVLKTECPNASFIPEIWQGHENNGEGFWTAFEKLENKI